VAKTHFNSVRLNSQEVSLSQSIICAEVITHHNITFELYLNVQTVISGPRWSASHWYVLLIMVSGVGGDFSQTGIIFVSKENDTRSRNRSHKLTPFSGTGNRLRFRHRFFVTCASENENFWRRK